MTAVSRVRNKVGRSHSENKFFELIVDRSCRWLFTWYSGL